MDSSESRSRVFWRARTMIRQGWAYGYRESEICRDTIGVNSHLSVKSVCGVEIFQSELWASGLVSGGIRQGGGPPRRDGMPAAMSWCTYPGICANLGLDKEGPGKYVIRGVVGRVVRWEERLRRSRRRVADGSQSKTNGNMNQTVCWAEFAGYVLAAELTLGLDSDWTGT